MIGIYGIRNKINNKIYIGQSRDIICRYDYHLHALRTNKNVHPRLQDDYNKFGCDVFELVILEVCAEEDLTLREQYWIDYYGGIESNNVYNSRIATPSRVQSDNVKHKISETMKIPDIRNKIVAANVGRPRTEDVIEKWRQSYAIGHITSEQTRQKISLSQKGKPRQNSRSIEMVNSNGAVIKVFDFMQTATKELGMTEIQIRRRISKSILVDGCLLRFGKLTSEL